MGLLFSKRCCFHPCCSCFYIFKHLCSYCKQNSVDVHPPKSYKVLILGLKSSGKTELAHILTEKERLDVEPTNGVKYFHKNLKGKGGGELSLVDIGGNEEMIKLWSHYYTSCMGLIYCYDFSLFYEDMEESFNLLTEVISHPFIQAKPILIVATRDNDVDDGVQLYDVENNFFLTTIAKFFGSASQMISYDSTTTDGKVRAHEGLNWLVQQMSDNYEFLKMRIKKDTNIKTWMEKFNNADPQDREKNPLRFNRFMKKQQSFRERFSRITNSGRKLSFRFRPRTAPSSVYAIAYKNMPSPSKPPPSHSLDEPFSSCDNTPCSTSDFDHGIEEILLPECVNPKPKEARECVEDRVPNGTPNIQANGHVQGI